jgi:hypothetical protein
MLTAAKNVLPGMFWTLNYNGVIYAVVIVVSNVLCLERNRQAFTTLTVYCDSNRPTDIHTFLYLPETMFHNIQNILDQ